MNSIVFIDTEIEVKSKKILDIGGITEQGEQFHSHTTSDFIQYIHSKEYICGHNIIKHDLPHLENSLGNIFSTHAIIDTLYFSPLLFPKMPYHALLKDDKLQTEEHNNPVNDALKARDLFYDEVSAFKALEKDLQQIYFALLGSKKAFASFFIFIDYPFQDIQVTRLIKERFYSQICENAPIEKLVNENPVELAYILALINTKSRYSITPPWVIKNYPDVERVMHLLRNKPCLTGCAYCNRSLDALLGINKYFGFDSYRTYEGKPLQEEAVRAALNNKSILAVFPTGGRKSITFQVPALMSG
jgi:ATP-dependent DNA helicase RecQ